MTRRRACAACWLVVAWLGAGAPLGRAGGSDGPDATLTDARAFLRTLGAQVADDRPRRLFLDEGEGRALKVRFERPGCVGFLAFGGGQVRDVDLALFSAGGLALDEDESVAPFAYVRTCVTRPASGYLQARMFAGRGQLVVLRVEQAPAGLGVPPRALEPAASSGGRLEPPRDVGPDPALPGGAQALQRLAEELSPLGYLAPPRALRSLRLPRGEAIASFPLEAGRCYLVVAEADRPATLVVEAVDPYGASRVTSGQGRARLAVCARRAAPYRLRLRSRPARVSVRLSLFEHSAPGPAAASDPAQGEPDAGLSLAAADGLRLAAAEAAYALDDRGMRVTTLGHAWAEPGVFLVWPFVVRAPGCYALVATTPYASRVDLRVTDELGELLGRDAGRARAPTVYFCVQAAGRYKAAIRSVSRPQRVGLVLGEGPL